MVREERRAGIRSMQLERSQKLGVRSQVQRRVHDLGEDRLPKGNKEEEKEKTKQKQRRSVEDKEDSQSDQSANLEPQTEFKETTMKPSKIVIYYQLVYIPTFLIFNTL